MQGIPLARRAEAVAPWKTAHRRDHISFESGHAFPGVLPDLTGESERALTHGRAETLQYGPRSGLPGLRGWIADQMTSDGARVSADQVLVTNGAKHALELVCRVLLDEGDAVVVTAPTYFSAIPILRSFGARFVEIGQDQNGPNTDALGDLLDQRRRSGTALPKFIYDVPDFHNPTGITTSLERRRALLEIATEFDVTLVEDSPYRSVRFDGEPVPPLKALDSEDFVLHLGTFAKLMAPGLRVGWVAGNADLVGRMTALKTDAGTCPLTQRIVWEFCRGGRLEDHTRRVRETYGSHRDRMVEAVRRELPDVQFDVPSGGYYLWLRLPAEVDGHDLEQRAHDEGVAIIAGRRFYACADTGHGANRVRLAYSHAGVEEIDEGVRRLAVAFRSVSAAAAVAAGR